MTRRFPRHRDENWWDELDRDPALHATIGAARDTTGAADTSTLETTLTAYRVAGATPAAPVPVERPTRRHRIVRAAAATTIATKVVLGVATAAALGGIGVAVTETVHHTPRPVPSTSSVAPPSPTGSDSGSDGGGGTPSSSPTSTPPTPLTTVTDTASVGTASPTGSPSGSVSRSASASPTPSSTKRLPSSTPSPTRSGPGGPSSSQTR